MKNYFILLFFIISNIIISQTVQKKFKDKFEEFDYYAKPNRTNDLSMYFKRNIDYLLLENYKFKDTLRKNNTVVLIFKLDKNNSAIDLKVYSPYTELNSSIIKAFEAYDLKNINIPEKSPLNNYTLQILSREGNKMIVNCSSNIIYDRFPVYEGCESSINFYNNKSCFNSLLKQHLGKNISLDLLEKKKLLGKLSLNPEFIVNQSGIVEKVKWNKATDSLTIETNRIMASFPKAKTPPTRNGNPTRLYIKEIIDLEIGSNNENYIENAVKAKDTTLNPNCELALHFKNFITEEEISSYIKKVNGVKVVIRFSIDKKGKMINLNASSINQELNNRLVEIFKKFSFEKLNIKSPNVLETYSYTIFTLEYNHKVIIHCNENPNIFSEVIFEKKCEKSDSAEDLRFCLQENIIYHILKNFDATLITQNDIYNRIRLMLSIQVDVDGTLSRINTREINPKYSNELDKIIKNMRKVYKPAYYNGTPIKSTLSIPISFRP